jgi:hypothetical protein
MALNFPNSPSDGDVFEGYVYNGTKEVWQVKASGVFPFYIGPTAPSNPENQTGWFNSETGKAYIYYEDVDGSQWVSITGVAYEPSVTDLGDLTDVDLGSLAEGDTIRYNSSTSSWENSDELRSPIRFNPQVISADTTIPSGYNGMTAGPVTIADGVTVTVSDGSAWSIV